MNCCIFHLLLKCEYLNHFLKATSPREFHVHNNLHLNLCSFYLEIYFFVESSFCTCKFINSIFRESPVTVTFHCNNCRIWQMHVCIFLVFFKNTKLTLTSSCSFHFISQIYQFHTRTKLYTIQSSVGLPVDWTLHGVHASCVMVTLSLGEPCLLVVSLQLCHHYYLHNKVEMYTSAEQK